MPFSGDDDDALLARFKAGEPDAFVAFYRRNLPAVLAYFLRRVREAPTQRDAAQFGIHQHRAVAVIPSEP